MNRIHGSHGEIGVDRAASTTTPTYTPLGSMNKWTLNLARDRADSTCFGDTTKQYVQGLPDVKGSLAGIFDTDDLTMLYIALGESKVGLKLTPSSLTPTVFFSGLAYLDGAVDVAVNGVVTVTGTFVGAGDWALEPADTYTPAAAAA
jgi:hypothetical protein